MGHYCLPKVLLTAAAILLTVSSVSGRPSADRSSPVSSIIQDCADCSLTIRAVGYWHFFRASPTPSVIDGHLDRVGPDMQIVLHGPPTQRVLEVMDQVRFVRLKEGETIYHVELRLEFRRGSEDIAIFHLNQYGEVFDGRHAYTTKDKRWPRKIFEIMRWVIYPTRGGGVCCRPWGFPRTDHN